MKMSWMMLTVKMQMMVDAEDALGAEVPDAETEQFSGSRQRPQRRAARAATQALHDNAALS